MASVRIENLKKYFGKVKALDGVDIEIEDGEFVVLLGPSGCGKTTLLRSISGLEKVTAGRVFFDIEEVTDLPPKDRNVSMVFQSYAVWPHMKVADNIGYPLKIKKYPREEIERRIKWAAELLNISELLDRYPAQLSGGQRQRVAVARAIVLEPRVLLMDEPLSNLDALLRVKMRSEIKKLQERIGVTTIYVTHDQVEAMTMGDRIAVMKSGKLQQFGKASEIYHEPANIFVAGFVGSPQMNFFRMRVTSQGTKLILKGFGMEIPLEKDPGKQEVVMGIRPEHIYNEKRENTKEIEVEVYFVEKLMSETIVHGSLPEGGRLVIKIPGDVDYKEGETIGFYVDLNRVHVFDPETERRISL